MDTIVSMFTTYFNDIVEYVKNLEKEVQSLKMKNRRLEEALNDGKKLSVNQETDKALEKAENNMLVKAHVEQLNDVIGTLRSEKVEMAAQLRKMQTRLHHLETHGDQTAKQVCLKPWHVVVRPCFIHLF